MDLQISVFLLFILFTAGHSLYCYECTDLMGFCTKKRVMCPLNAPNCVSLTTVIEIGSINTKMNVQGCSYGCVSGSMNLGIVKSSHFCCDTSFCNARTAQDPRTIVPNGKKCYSCDGESCSNILSCLGTEDRCITATGTFAGQTAVVKGCVSEAICHSKTLAYTVDDFSCCKGNLCNDDESDTASVTQSFIQNVTQSFMNNGDKAVSESVTQSFMNNGDKGVTESVTQSFMNNGDKGVTESVTQSFMNNGDKGVTRSAIQSFIQSVTRRFVHNNAEIVKYSDAKSVKKSFTYTDAKSARYNVAQRVTQSFLFLFCSLLSFILLH